MTYIELLNEFWELDRFNPFENVDTKLYMMLLDESNIRKWINPIVLHTYYLEERLRIKRKAIGEARNRLKQRGLIDFIAKTNNPTIYLLSKVEISNLELFQLFPTGNNKETIGKQLGNNWETIGKHNNIDYIDYKDNKTSVTPVQGLLFPEENKTQKKSRDDQWQPPSLEEVKSHFKANGEGLPDWKELACRFYDHYTAYGWIGSGGRKIRQWDSLANRWIFDEIKKHKNNDENTKTIFGTPSSGVQIRGKVTPSCGLKRRDKSGQN